MSDQNNGSFWVWFLVAIVVIIIVVVIIIIALVAFESRNIGKACGPDNLCPSGLTCVNGKCKLNNGQICETNDQCVSSVCSGFPDFRCVSATGPTGTRCTSDSQCSGPNEKCNSQGQCVSGFRGTCNLSSDCFYQPAVCTGPSGGPKICLVGTGGTCANDNDCTSGVCNKTGENDLGVCGTGMNPQTLNDQQTTFSTMPIGMRMVNGIGMGMGEMTTEPTNPTFNVESVPTQAERMVNFHTPVPQEIDSPFKQIRRDMMMSKSTTQQSPVIDVTNYSNSTLALTKNGQIIRETDGEREIVANNINLRRLEGFNGTLYGISVDGRIFALNNDTFETRKWMWNLAPFPTGVIHTSATHDGKYFWVQTNNTGLLYDRKLKVREKNNMKNKKRIYGNDKDIYVEIDLQSNKATLYPNNAVVEDVSGAVITHDNHLKVLKPSQTRLFSDIRLINWTPAYIKKSI